MSEKKMPYAPGSKDAVAVGCICPVLDNSAGAGAYVKSDGTPVFWYDTRCPLHGKAEDVDPETVLHKNITEKEKEK